MAEKKTPAVDYWDELVPVRLFKDGREYKDDVYVCVNGENCVVKRGVDVMIKRKFKAVLDAAEQQNLAAAETADYYQNEYKKAQSNLE